MLWAVIVTPVQSAAAQPSVNQPAGRPSIEEHRREREVRAQEAAVALAGRTFWLALAQLVVGAAGLGFIAYTLIQNRRAVREATKANQIGRQAIEAAERPWLSFSNISLEDIALRPHGLDLSIMVSLRNGGRSPARNVLIDMGVCSFGEKPNYTERQLEMADRAAKHARTREQMTVFPNEELRQGIGVTLPREHFRDEHGGIIFMLPVIYGCVTYSSPYDSEAHQTAFVLHLKTDSGRKVMTATVKDGAYQAGFTLAEIYLHHMFDGWWAT